MHSTAAAVRSACPGGTRKIAALSSARKARSRLPPREHRVAHRRAERGVAGGQQARPAPPRRGSRAWLSTAWNCRVSASMARQGMSTGRARTAPSGPLRDLGHPRLGRLQLLLAMGAQLGAAGVERDRLLERHLARPRAAPPPARARPAPPRSSSPPPASRPSSAMSPLHQHPHVRRDRRGERAQIISALESRDDPAAAEPVGERRRAAPSPRRSPPRSSCRLASGSRACASNPAEIRIISGAMRLDRRQHPPEHPGAEHPAAGARRQRHVDDLPVRAALARRAGARDRAASGGSRRRGCARRPRPGPGCRCRGARRSRRSPPARARAPPARGARRSPRCRRSRTPSRSRSRHGARAGAPRRRRSGPRPPSPCRPPCTTAPAARRAAASVPGVEEGVGIDRREARRRRPRLERARDSAAGCARRICASSAERRLDPHQIGELLGLERRQDRLEPLDPLGMPRRVDVARGSRGG